MARIQSGDTLQARTLRDFRGREIVFPAPEGLTHLQLRRYAGCPVCNLHLRTFTRRARELAEAGVHEIVAFYSPPDELAKHQDALPFQAIADPGRELYHELGADASAAAMLHPSTLSAGVHGMITGRGSMPPRPADALGKPVDLLIDPSGKVVAVKYGTHANDQWTVDEVLELVRRSSPPRSGAPHG